MLRSALYLGTVMHRRHRPRQHALRYNVFWTLFDLDALEALSRRLRFFSYNKFNFAALFDVDHGDGSTTPLRDQVTQHLRAAGFEAGKVFLLCMPRVAGYSFNPISIYFCYADTGSLNAILYEVHNTFGERHSYLIPVTGEGSAIEQSCQKEFYVSPFMAMGMSYSFRVSISQERINVAIRGADENGPLIDASLKGDYREMTDRALMRTLLTHPLVTLKVIAAIHWHALKMILKGYRIAPRPKPPENLVTVVGGRP